MLMNFSAPSRRRHSKAYLAPYAQRWEQTFNPASEIPFPRRQLLAPAGSEIGSIPINVLAIALALAARLSRPKREAA